MKTFDRLCRPDVNVATSEACLIRPDRRLFLRGGLVASGSLALGGCDLTGNPQVTAYSGGSPG